MATSGWANRTIGMLLVAMAGSCGWGAPPDRYREVAQRLASADTRPVRGRLFDLPHQTYSPAPGPTRGGGVRLPIRGEQEVSSGSWLSAREREAMAVDWLAAGKVSDAVEELERAVSELPRDARAQNHLAAAKLELWQRSGDFAQAVGALAAAERSLQLAPSAEARWNRALALAAIPLPYRAAEAWQEIVQQEAVTAWAEEAQAIADALPRTPEVQRAALCESDERSSPQLEQGCRDLELAVARWRAEDRRGAATAYQAAQANFAAVASPLVLAARLGRAQVTGGGGWPELDRLLRQAQAQGGPIEAATLRYMGTVSGREGRTAGALDFYRQAEERFLSLHQEEAAVTAVLGAEIYAEANQRPEAQAALARAFEWGDRVRDPLNRYALFVVAASALSFLEPAAAVEVRREAAAQCAELPERPLCPVDSTIHVTRLLRLLPDAEASAIEAELGRAASLLARGVGSEEGRRESLTDLAAEEARWRADVRNPRRDLESAVERSAEARANFLEDGRIPPYLHSTEEAAGWLGELGQAREMEELLESARALVRTRSAANKAVGLALPARAIYERLIDLRLKAGAEDAALDLVEELRSLDRPGGAGGGPGPASRRVVPVGTAAVVYWTWDDRGVAWLVTADGTALVDLNAESNDRLRQELGALSRVRQEGEWQQATGELFERWLAPLVDRLQPGTERLLVVPDRALADVPFRALWQPRSRRYLEESLAVELSPMLGDLRPVPEWTPPRSILGFGVDRFASALGLAELSEVSSEAKAVAQDYPRQLHCKGQRWQDFQVCAGGAEVIHLATHARSREGDAGRSWIAFADQTVSLDRLNQELPRLPGTRLVVLSACQSSFSAGGTLGGLAPPFLAAGAEAVVGSLWPIEDTELLRHFMTAFHQSYRRSGQVAQALSQVRAANPAIAARPWLWGAFTIVTRHPSGGF